MVVQHNIGALTAYRNLGINQGGLNGNLEKLSSGYRINRAGDDAAGLAISENMRAQIRGLNQAARNAQEAVGLIKTAEGGLTEIHAMLQRMTTLATQGANGTYNRVKKKNIQARNFFFRKKQESYQKEKNVQDIQDLMKLSDWGYCEFKKRNDEKINLLKNFFKI